MPEVYNKVKNASFIILSLAILLISYSYYLRSKSYIAQKEQVKDEHEYQLIQLGEMKRDQFLLDKKTGRTWINVCSGTAHGSDCDSAIVWQERMAIGLNGYTQENYNDYLDFLEKLHAKKSENKK